MGLVFGLALRQTEGLIGSVIGLLGLDLAVPDHSTLSRRAKTLEVPHLRSAGTGPLHLLVDSTGLRLGGAGEWLVEKHGTSRRRSWRKLPIGVDAASGEIVAVAVTRKDIDDAAMAEALLDQIADPIASFTADGGYDQDQVSQSFGHTVNLIAPQLVKPYVKRSKNDAADAGALCEAMSRPTISCR
jgi:IS5 family transposase